MSERTFFPAILLGLITILLIILSTSVIISIVLSFTSLTESSVSWLITSIAFIALFLGGAMAGIKAKRKGWLIGGSTAIIFSIITFLIQYLGYDTTFTPTQYVIHACYILAAVVGGVISVNMFHK